MDHYSGPLHFHTKRKVIWNCMRTLYLPACKVKKNKLNKFFNPIPRRCSRGGKLLFSLMAEVNLTTHREKYVLGYDGHNVTKYEPLLEWNKSN